jgi:hypothetical protein
MNKMSTFQIHYLVCLLKKLELIIYFQTYQVEFLTLFESLIHKI